MTLVALWNQQDGDDTGGDGKTDRQLVAVGGEPADQAVEGPAAGLDCMCGIVGYIGYQQALERSGKLPLLFLKIII